MICNTCNQEMSDKKTKSCLSSNTIDFPDGSSEAPVPFVALKRGIRCHDCGIANGGIHHPGCDAEVCPRCDGQLITCGCTDEEDNEYGEDSGFTSEDEEYDFDDVEDTDEEDEEEDYDYIDDESEDEEEDEYDDPAYEEDED